MNIRFLVGDAIEQMAKLDADSVDCVVTSPPYWNLRNYDADGQIGLEPTFADHLSTMIDVFRAVRRVLKPTGTVWLNYGDCYATTSTRGGGWRGHNKGQSSGRPDTRPVANGVIKPKDLCLMPARLAIALQEDGWFIRSEIVWGKPNPMPESVTDRPATAHEKIFMLTKSARYYYNLEASRLAATADTVARYHRGRSQNHKYADGGPGNQTIAKTLDHMAAKFPRDSKPVAGWQTTEGSHKSIDHNRDGVHPKTDKQSGHGKRHAGFNDRWNTKIRGVDPRHEGHINHASLDAPPKQENAKGFRGGSYVNGQPSQRATTGNDVVNPGRNLRNYEPAPVEVWNMATRPFKEAHFATFPPELVERCLTAGCPTGGLVLDPFGGSGTVGLVANRMQVGAVLIDINPEYVAMARRRCATDAGLFA